MSVVAQAKALVVKVGSSLVTDRGRGLDAGAIGRWSAQIAELVRALRWRRPWFVVSALSGEGCAAVTRAIARELAP